MIQRIIFMIGAALVTPWFPDVASGAARSFGVVTVGPYGTAANCTTNDLQAAIRLAATDDWDDEIRVTKAGPDFLEGYSGQALRIPNDPANQPGQTITIIGGYDSCLPEAQPTGRTRLSGAGGAARSVVEIRGNSDVRLAHLDIVDGDENLTSNGGGVDINGSGHLFLDDVQLQDNHAGFGGGLYANGSGGELRVYLEDSIIINGNTAEQSGGGIYVSGSAKLDWTGSNGSLYFNRAIGVVDGSGDLFAGYGGGLYLHGGRARIAGSGLAFGDRPLPLIGVNSARYGGGIALLATEDREPVVQLEASASGTPQFLSANSASVAGGAIYAKTYIGSLGPERDAVVCLSDTSITDNRAPLGAAIRLDNYSRAGFDDWRPQIYYNDTRHATPTCSVPEHACPPEGRCSAIRGNTSQDVDGDDTAGAIISIANGESAFPYTTFRDLSITENRGGSILRVDGGRTMHMINALIADNLLSQSVIESTTDASLILQVTLAGNLMPDGRAALRLQEHPQTDIDHQSRVQDSLIWQPGHPAFALSGEASQFTTTYVIGNDEALLGWSPTNRVADPAFVDPQNGDYRLRASSIAVDFAPSLSASAFDIDGAPRNADDGAIANQYGPADVGAYERRVPASGDRIFASPFERL